MSLPPSRPKDVFEIADEQRPEKPRRRWLWIGLIVVAGFLFALYWFWLRDPMGQKLREQMAKMDQEDPGWRLEEIEASREKVPDAENGALVVKEVKALLPKGWGSDPLFGEIPDLPSPVLLNEKQAAFLKKELGSVEKALAKARTLTKYHKGRFPIQWTDDYISTTLEPFQECRSIALLLGSDVKLSCHEGDLQRAWDSCLAIFHLQKMIGDAPNMTCQLIHISVRYEGLFDLAKILAQGEVEEDKLAAMQALLVKEAAEPLMLYGVRGEQACINHLFVNLENGKVPLAEITKWFKTGNCVVDFFKNPGVKESHLFILEYSQRAVKLAKLKGQEQLQGFQKLENELRLVLKDPNVPYLVQLVPRFSEAFSRNQTHMYCAVVGLALERYRLKHQHWPKDLNVLVQEGLLKEVPVDPFSGKPLQHLQTKEGVVVFSVGVDGKYKGQRPDEPRTEELPIEFRLWNVNLRRQPPKILWWEIEPNFQPPRNAPAP